MVIQSFKRIGSDQRIWDYCPVECFLGSSFVWSVARTAACNECGLSVRWQERLKLFLLVEHRSKDLFHKSLPLSQSRLLLDSASITIDIELIIRGQSLDLKTLMQHYLLRWEKLGSSIYEQIRTGLAPREQALFTIDRREKLFQSTKRGIDWE